MGVGGQRHSPAALRPGKTLRPLYRRLGGPQGRSGWVRNISPPPGFDPGQSSPVAQSLYRLSYRAHKYEYYATKWYTDVCIFI